MRQSTRLLLLTMMLLPIMMILLRRRHVLGLRWLLRLLQQARVVRLRRAAVGGRVYGTRCSRMGRLGVPAWAAAVAYSNSSAATQRRPAALPATRRMRQQLPLQLVQALLHLLAGLVRLDLVVLAEAQVGLELLDPLLILPGRVFAHLLQLALGLQPQLPVVLALLLELPELLAQHAVLARGGEIGGRGRSHLRRDSLRLEGHERARVGESSHLRRRRWRVVVGLSMRLSMRLLMMLRVLLLHRILRRWRSSRYLMRRRPRSLCRRRRV